MVMAMDITYLVDINGVSSKIFFANGAYHSNRRGEIIKASAKDDFKDKLIKKYGLSEQAALKIVNHFE